VNVYKYTEYDTLLKEAASYIIKIARASTDERGSFSLVLAGGNTPRPLYKTLSSERFSKNMPWEKTYFFWGDERFVPKDHPESNYRMVYETLFSSMSVSRTNIFPIPTDMDFEDAADDYEATLRRFFKGADTPSFDLLMLGMGKDGHTASLFSNDPALEEKKRWIMAVIAPECYPVRKRITLTLPVINSARNVLFLVTGEEKREILSNILSGKGNYPAQRVNPNGRLCIFTDIVL
jgi:6-phosphogluconolactonase